MYIYNNNFPNPSEITYYNHLRNHLDAYEAKPQSFIINLDNPRKSHRCIQIIPAFITDVSDVHESAYTIMLNLNRTWLQKQGDFFVESPIILLAAIIWYLKIYENGKYCTFPTQSTSSIDHMLRYSRFWLHMMSLLTTSLPLWILGRVELKTNCKDR